MSDITSCMPAVIFVTYMLIQIGVDLYSGYYNISVLKALFMIIYALLLNFLCSSDMYIFAWFLVFIPFALLSLIIVILLHTSKMKETTGTASTTEEVVTPVVILPNKQVIMPINNCIVITNVEPPKHGVRTQYTNSLFCLGPN